MLAALGVVRHNGGGSGVKPLDNLIVDFGLVAGPCLLDGQVVSPAQVCEDGADQLIERHLKLRLHHARFEFEQAVQVIHIGPGCLPGALRVRVDAHAGYVYLLLQDGQRRIPGLMWDFDGQLVQPAILVHGDIFLRLDLLQEVDRFVDLL